MSSLLALAAASSVLGAALQSATGSGFALLAAPAFFAAFGPQAAIGFLLVLSVETSVLTIAGERRRPQPVVRDTAIIIVLALPGAVLGAVVLSVLDAASLRYAVAVGVLIALLVRWATARRMPLASRSQPWWSAPAAGFAAGLLTTTTNTSGPPLLLHLTGNGAEPQAVRDTISACYIGLSLVSAAALCLTRTTGAVPHPATLAVLAPLAAAGQFAGRPVFRRLAAGRHYESAVTAVLALAAGVGALGAAL
ncbi:MAG TPA: sulfite exporter TauE/SafE family protein [Jatrophihabitantaceae bacterium]|jgi:hypothetical protein